METQKTITAITVTLLLVMSGSVLGVGTQYYVDCTGSDNNNGLSWANAFATIQKAIDTAASRDDTIDVNECTYHENIDFKGKEVTVQSTDYDDWDVIAATIIDASGSGNVVTFSTSERDYAILRGFTIEDGNRGIYVYGAEPTIQYCLIQDNDNTAHGGGMLVDADGHPDVLNCVFKNNKARWGGGVEIDMESGGDYEKCIFIYNEATVDGAGIYIDDNSGSSIVDCVIVSNTGEGIAINDDSDPSIENCVIANNTEEGVFCDEVDEAEIYNCTIYGNGDEGIQNEDNSDTEVCNCIIWGNGEAIDNYSSTITVTYSDVEGGYTGTGNINCDPDFCDTTDLDGPDNIYGTCDDGLALRSTSCCIDAGDNSCARNYDICGNDRIIDGDCNSTEIVDMGAYEYNPTCP